MNRRSRSDHEQPLLDLTLREAVPSSQERRELDEPSEVSFVGDEIEFLDPPPGADAAPPPPASRRARCQAAAADGLILLGVAACALLAVSALGGAIDGELWPGIALFLLSFSFLYATLPLLFWGQTPGMAWANIRAADRDQQPVTFRQSVLRWLGSLTTVLLVGAPLLWRRSFVDRFSGSLTVRVGSLPAAGLPAGDR